MKLSQQSQSVIESAIRKAIGKFACGCEQTIVTDIHIQPNQNSGELCIFDDEDDGGSTTTVTEVKPNSTDGDASFYTLQGVKVSRPVKGVYIHNGKKFIK